MWHGTADLGPRPVLAEPFVNDLTEQIVLSPGQILDLRDEFGSHPMDAAQDERRTKPASARRRDVERHLERR